MSRVSIPLLAMMVALIPCALSAQDAVDDPVSIVAPDAQKGVYTTQKSLPWEKAGALPSPALLKLDEQGAQKPVPAKPEAAKPKWLATVPFGKASSDVSQPLPTGPRAATAVPVQDVDAIEVTEPAAASTAPLEADPASENPQTPTEETSPIFSTDNASVPHKVVFSVLNKVTGRSERIEAKPGEVVTIGKLEIKAIACQTSTPHSQLDYAGLFELNEFVPGEAQTKQLFRGWMYATSPSITSLEHPIYDVTMVACKGDQPKQVAAKKADTPAAPEKDEAPVVEEAVED